MTTPFDSIEGAQEYLAMLREALEEAKQSADSDILAETQSKASRRIDALRIIAYKLDKLDQHIKASCRLLNDLRSLRRLLLEERAATVTQQQKSSKLIAAD